MTHELLREKRDIEEWLNKYKITDYSIVEDEKYGHIVNVNYNVCFPTNVGYHKVSKEKREGIDVLLVKFGTINGYFSCDYNKLTSLYGCPDIIHGDFTCIDNRLEDIEIEQLPKYVQSNISLLKNPLLEDLQQIEDLDVLRTTLEQRKMQNLVKEASFSFKAPKI